MRKPSRRKRRVATWDEIDAMSEGPSPDYLSHARQKMASHDALTAYGRAKSMETSLIVTQSPEQAAAMMQLAAERRRNRIRSAPTYIAPKIIGVE